HRLVHTLRASLLGVDGLRIGDVCTAGLYEMPIVVVFLQTFLEVLFNATHFKSRHALAIREFRKSIFVACNTSELFNMRVPGLQIFVANRPVDSKTVACRTFKIEVAPALGLSCP